MASGPDMTAPVTRGEMYEALDTWGGAIIAKLVATFDAKFDAKFDAFADEMRALVKTSETAIIDRVTAMFDPYRSLPERVTVIEAEALPARVGKLETKVFAPKRRASKTSRRRRS